MNRKFFSMVSAFAVLAIFLIVQATRESAEAVLLPSDLVKTDSAAPLHRIRVAGKITDPVEYKVEPSLELTFSIRDPGPAGAGKPVPVVFHGFKPDMFAAGRDVIIDGEFEGGVIHASKLLTQCPSKYQPPEPGRRGTAGAPS
jgi:cytochrome c-type biogenesis protein CcmE